DALPISAASPSRPAGHSGAAPARAPRQDRCAAARNSGSGCRRSRARGFRQGAVPRGPGAMACQHAGSWAFSARFAGVLPPRSNRQGESAMTGRLEYRALSDQAYAAIKQELISGRFAPRQMLVLRTLAETYGISTTPVREALQRLVGEGLLEMLPNRSIAVPDWDPAKFSELYRIRCELEGLAA